MGLFGKKKTGSLSESSSATKHEQMNPAQHTTDTDFAGDANAKKSYNAEDDAPVRLLTVRTFVMTILAAMGGFIFGYDTGQISGFLEMKVFLRRFGENGPNGYHFTNVRSGLIVGLVSLSCSQSTHVILVSSGPG